jgi:hypothetical protein
MFTFIQKYVRYLLRVYCFLVKLTNGENEYLCIIING